MHAAAPSVNVVIANRITYNSASLNALVNPGNETTTVSFEYGFTNSYGSNIAVPGTSNGSAYLFKTARASDLIPGKTYHYRAKAANSSGTVYGLDRTFIAGSHNSNAYKGDHSIIVGDEGIVYTFGFNGSGQLGDSTTRQRTAPTKVKKGAYNGTAFLGDNINNPIISVASGDGHCIALAADGTVYAFGINGLWQLGDSTTTNRFTPVKVKKGAYGGTSYLGDNNNNPVISIATGYAHSLALTADGTVYGFGRNNYGQLGDSTTTNKPAPVQVLKGAYSGNYYLGDNVNNPIIAIAAGTRHSMVIDAAGTVYSFGRNAFGMLGDSTTTDRKTPVKVKKGAYNGTNYLGDNVSNPIVSFSPGTFHTLAADAVGTVYAFGANDVGQLGDNTTTNRYTPIKVLKGAYPGATNLGDNINYPIISVSAGYSSNLALASDGSVYSFGLNNSGQLGDNSTTDKKIAVQVKGASNVGFLDLIACEALTNLPSVGNTIYTSTNSNTDDDGWIHYCTSNNELLLALKLGSSGAIIPADSVSLKLGSTLTFSSNSSGGMITNNLGYAMIDRRWNVAPTAQPSGDSVGVRYYYRNAEYAALQTALANLANPSTLSSVNQMSMYKATSGAAYANPHTANGIVYQNTLVSYAGKYWTAGTAGSDHYAQFWVTSFSGGGGGGGGAGPAPLPVTLLNFTAQAVANNYIYLQWATASEIDNTGFEIQRSTDGKNFETIGWLDGNMNSNRYQTYGFNDKNVVPNTTYYYQLKQVDLNNKFQYSGIRSASLSTLKNNALGMVVSNPFTDQLYITTNSAENTSGIVSIMDLEGRLLDYAMLTIAKGDHTSIYTPRAYLAAGIYLLKLTDAAGQNTVVKIVKQ